MSRPAASIKLDADLAAEAREAAAAEGVGLDAFVRSLIERAVSDFRGRAHWSARAARADVDKAREILRRPGRGQAPVSGDGLPAK